MSTSIVLDANGHPRPPYRGAAVAPVVTGRCWICQGSGFVELGLQGGSNLGTGHRCSNCAGTGFVWSEVAA